MSGTDRLRIAQVALLLVVLQAAAANAKFYSAEIARERLITDIFVNYDAGARPAPKSQRIDLFINIELQHFSFQDADGSFNFVGQLDVIWKDPKLIWNPQDYNNVSRLAINRKLVWLPDLEVYNNAPDKFLRMHRSGVVVLEHTGRILWTDNIDATIFCTTSMRDWPHDRHACKLSVGSWTYDGFELDIRNPDPNLTMNFDGIDMPNMEYRIVNYTAERVETIYQCCTEPYITINYNITFQRRSSFAAIFRIIALAVILLALLALAMEPHRSEKLWLSAISFLVININLLHFASSIGRFAREAPLIVAFFTSSLFLVTVAHMVSVFSLLATRSRYNGRLPSWCSAFLQFPLVQLIAAPERRRASSVKCDGEHADFEDVKLQEYNNLISAEFFSNEWTQLAKFLERVTMVALCLLFLVLGSTCYV